MAVGRCPTPTSVPVAKPLVDDVATSSAPSSSLRPFTSVMMSRSLWGHRLWLASVDHAWRRKFHHSAVHAVILVRPPWVVVSLGLILGTHAGVNDNCDGLSRLRFVRQPLSAATSSLWAFLARYLSRHVSQVLDDQSSIQYPHVP